MKLRQSNFELVRIIAMLMIVGAHYLGHGILKVRTADMYNIFLQGDIINQVISVLYSAGGKTGVALFFMITGYFIGHKKDLISQKKVVCQCLFYAILLTSITIVIGALHLSNNWGGAVFEMIRTLPIPISAASWWFVTTYVLVVLFAPLLNRLVDNVNNKGALALVLYFGILYGICGFGTAYYNILRAPFYYLAGVFIRNRNLTLNKPSHRCLALSLFVVAWLIYSAVRYLQIDHFYDTVSVWIAFVLLSDYLMSGILIPVISISLFLFLASFNFSNVLVNKIASTTFGVYLLHDSNVGRKLIWNKLVNPENTQFPLVWYQYALSSIATIVGIFILCSLVDLLRQSFFEKWMNNKCEFLVNKFKSSCYFTHKKEA